MSEAMVAQFSARHRGRKERVLAIEDYRNRAEALKDAEGLEPDERAIVGWLIELADRVGVEDISRH